MERTFSIIKPNAVADGTYGRIIDMLLNDGFRITGIKMVSLDYQKAESFYSIHKGRPFFDELMGFMTSGPCIVLALQRHDAVSHLRELCGNTDPAKADDNTIRRLFGSSVTRNAIHASDSGESALKEIHFFFSESELMHNV